MKEAPIKYMTKNGSLFFHRGESLFWTHLHIPEYLHSVGTREKMHSSRNALKKKRTTPVIISTANATKSINFVDLWSSSAQSQAQLPAISIHMMYSKQKNSELLGPARRKTPDHENISAAITGPIVEKWTWV